MTRLKDIEDDTAQELLTARLTVMFLLPFITFILGMSSTWIAKLFHWDKEKIAGLQGKRAQFIFSELLSFSGGVLLSTVFMHLLPDLRNLCIEMVGTGELPDLGPGIPWAELLLCSGLFMVYLIEETAHMFVHWQSKTKHPKPVQPTAATACVEEIQQNVTGIPDESAGDAEKQALEVEIEVKLPQKSSHSHSHGEGGHGHSHGEGGHGHSHAPTTSGDDSIITNLRNILTIFALSFHCIFEGIAVAMEPTAGEVWYLFGAIASHKFIIAFCIGVELLVSGTRVLFTYIYIAIFGLVSAVGIGIGMIVAGSGNSGDTDTGATVVMQGLAAGTIVYVTFFEILQREKTHKQNGFAQLAAIMLGFAAMIGLMNLAEDP